jgi:hypothetical protein
MFWRAMQTYDFNIYLIIAYYHSYKVITDLDDLLNKEW